MRGLWLCMRERRWEYFSFDIPFAPGTSLRSDGWDLNKSIRRAVASLLSAPRVTPLGLDSLATFYNCALSLNMYRFAPRARSPNSSSPFYLVSDDITASAITRNICFKDYEQPKTRHYHVTLLVMSINDLVWDKTHTFMKIITQNCGNIFLCKDAHINYTSESKAKVFHQQAYKQHRG